VVSRVLWLCNSFSISKAALYSMISLACPHILLRMSLKEMSHGQQCLISLTLKPFMSPSLFLHIHIRMRHVMYMVVVIVVWASRVTRFLGIRVHRLSNPPTWNYWTSTLAHLLCYRSWNPKRKLKLTSSIAGKFFQNWSFFEQNQQPFNSIHWLKQHKKSFENTTTL